MTAAPGFWRILPDEPAPDAAVMAAAGRAGKGALARCLREARLRLGVQRSASLLRRAEREGRFGGPLRVVVAAGFQPRAIEDALLVSFAIAGFAVELVPVDGFPALGATACEGVDFALLPVLSDTPETLALVSAAGAGFSQRAGVPVLVTMPGMGDAAGEDPAEGVTLLRVPIPAPVVDGRFGRTFGDLPSPEAADAMADAAAGFAARLKGTAPKLVVSDLDGTLWAGTLGEDGSAGLVIHRAYAETLGQLARRGFVLAIASRNDPADIAAAFAAHPDWVLGRESFACLSAGWEDKDALVADCLSRLSLSPGHMVFVDDDPVNCAKVALRFPQADVRFLSGDPDDFARRLSADPLLAGSGREGGERAEQYRRRAAVEELRHSAPDVATFLRALGTRLSIVPLETAVFPRAAELAARVNQFALTDERLTALQLARRGSSLDFMVRLDDAFGSHGLVGLVLARARGKAAVVDGFFLSCRALGRGVEDAMLAALARLAADAGLERLEGRIDELPRNEPARRCFSRYADPQGGRSWTVPVDAATINPPEGVTLAWNTAKI